MGENDSTSKSEKRLRSYKIIAGVLALTVAGSVGGLITESINNRIPKETVQNGYVQPNKLEIKVSDLVGDGNKETVLQYDGKSYLFIDKDGVPTAQSYEIIPAQMAQIRYLDK
jgi:hypothetical protein